jgi:hypothetical protein
MYDVDDPPALNVQHRNAFPQYGTSFEPLM